MYRKAYKCLFTDGFVLNLVFLLLHMKHTYYDISSTVFLHTFCTHLACFRNLQHSSLLKIVMQLNPCYSQKLNIILMAECVVIMMTRTCLLLMHHES